MVEMLEHVLVKYCDLTTIETGSNSHTSTVYEN